MGDRLEVKKKKKLNKVYLRNTIPQNQLTLAWVFFLFPQHHYFKRYFLIVFQLAWDMVTVKATTYDSHHSHQTIQWPLMLCECCHHGRRPSDHDRYVGLKVIALNNSIDFEWPFPLREWSRPCQENAPNSIMELPDPSHCNGQAFRPVAFI